MTIFLLTANNTSSTNQPPKPTTIQSNRNILSNNISDACKTGPNTNQSTVNSLVGSATASLNPTTAQTPKNKNNLILGKLYSTQNDDTPPTPKTPSQTNDFKRTEVDQVQRHMTVQSMSKQLGTSTNKNSILTPPPTPGQSDSFTGIVNRAKEGLQQQHIQKLVPNQTNQPAKTESNFDFNIDTALIANKVLNRA
ncbi:unnamed protein product, partial [Brachionus calyciflorus]